jgi:hypothetical protein
MFKRSFIVSIAVVSYSVASNQALVLKPTSVFAPSRLGSVAVSHNGTQFQVSQNGVTHPVMSHNMDKELRSVCASGKLPVFLKNGYVSVNQNSNNEFALASNYRLKGGGPISAGIAYWLTKTLCYGTAVAAVGTAVTATGGGALGVLTAGGTTVLTGGAPLAVTTTATMITQAGLAASAAEATIGTITAAGGVVKAMAAVEAASTAVGSFFLALPIP